LTNLILWGGEGNLMVCDENALMIVMPLNMQTSRLNKALSHNCPK